jgi:hypothetical protein
LVLNFNLKNFTFKELVGGLEDYHWSLNVRVQEEIFVFFLSISTLNAIFLSLSGSVSGPDCAQIQHNLDPVSLNVDPNHC